MVKSKVLIIFLTVLSIVLGVGHYLSSTSDTEITVERKEPTYTVDHSQEAYQEILKAKEHKKLLDKQAKKEIQYKKKQQTVQKPKESNEVASRGSKNTSKDYYIVDAEVTAYNVSLEQCGKTDGITASGQKVYEGGVAGVPQLPFGTKVEINGQVYTVNDRGGAIKIKPGNVYRFDIYMHSYDRAIKWGRRKMKVKIYK